MNKTSLFYIVLFACSTNLLADSPSFDFVEIGYTSVDIKGESKNYVGYDLRGSYSLGDNFYIGGDAFSADISGVFVRRQVVTIGVGYRTELSSNNTVFAELDGVVFNPHGNGNHENGFELTVGVRNKVTERLELKAVVEYFNTESYKTTTFVAGAAFEVFSSFALYSDFNIDSDDSRYSFGVRYSF